ncbi:hypothetical protein SUBVAR_07042 [Subdoligranulum variabile DSM 15176]|uniref:Uncharacterized protein n=1 Tax=Subdoligranulum variabile DSM 15176 TaxID=411471 RepID=D1PRL3_9FIRM|nr:hypothetical protein SUBVAR_07042 [Subdoligranulum variabile DSM 15176]
MLPKMIKCVKKRAERAKNARLFTFFSRTRETYFTIRGYTL